MKMTRTQLKAYKRYRKAHEKTIIAAKISAKWREKAKKIGVVCNDIWYAHSPDDKNVWFTEPTSFFFSADIRENVSLFKYHGDILMHTTTDNLHFVEQTPL